MALTDAPIDLYDPAAGHAALTVVDLRAEPGQPLSERTNRFALCLIPKGEGCFSVDAAAYRFRAPSLLCFGPYQNWRIDADFPVRVTSIQFHANFLCIETYHDEIGCNGVLFNDLYGIPAVDLGEGNLAAIQDLFGQIRREMAESELAQTELLLSYLKVLLIKLSRLKLEQQGGPPGASATRLPPDLEALRELIEKHYTRLHTPADYARLLHMTPKTLGKIVKSHLHKTLTELIRERILKHAKWELLHTLTPIKQIARELGYADELYFSRLFKRATGCSPTFFREYETEIRGGRNLSMSSTPMSIPESVLRRDTVAESRI